MDLKKALRNNEFHVRYQPQINMYTGEIIGAEALIRLKKLDGVVISPALFIPALEKTGGILELDEEVLKIVCSDIINAAEEGIQVPPISVNLSRLHMGRPDTADRLKRIVESHGICKNLLVFELTESAVYNDEKEELNRLLGKLRSMGFQISLDDYGTGFSSLKLLSDISFDYIKLDRYFVSQIGDPRTDIVLRDTIAMAKHLETTVIAEGVENIKQLNFLKESGCSFAQGYYFYRPISKEEFFKKLSSNRKDFFL